MPETITESEKAKQGDAKIRQTLHEFKHGTLHSGTGHPGKKGPKVTDRRQAIAIALSQAGRSNKAANYGATRGQPIVGHLYRGNDGKFANGSSSGSFEAGGGGDWGSGSPTVPELKPSPKAKPKALPKPKKVKVKVNKSPKERIALALKAANYSARVGQSISGNLFRGTGGQFTGGPGGGAANPATATAPAKPDKAATADRQRQQRQALADQQRQERQGVRDQAKTDAQKRIVENVGNLAEKLLSSDMAEVLTVGDPVGNINGVEPQYGDKLVSQGLAVKYPDGTYDLSGTGRSMINAMAKGNERQAKIAIMRAQALADRKAAAAARRGKRGRKEWLALAIKAAGSFSAYKNYAHKEVKAEIALREAEAHPFTAYKDMTGRWRWIVRSSSAFEDRDGETVSLKALEGATRKMDARGKYGILDWWHTPAALGTCDFSAMHGLMLVESGSFKSEALGERISAAIANKEFDPAVSLMFAHNEPGPQVVPGRVFDDIEIIQRSLLPAERASNIATTVQIINLADKAQATKKEVNLKMDALKEEKLKTLIGPELFEAFMSGTELAEKSLMTAGFSWKAIAPPPLVVEDPTKKKIDIKAAPPAATAPNGMVEGSPEEEAAETPEEEAAEPPDPGEGDTGGGGDADQIIQGLYDEVDAIIGRRMQSTADEIVAKLQTIKAVSTKETEDALGTLTVALKENTTTLEKVLGENTALKARLDALEGKLPPAVMGRISQGKGQQVVTDPQIVAALKEQNKPTVAANDPFKLLYDRWTAQGIDPQQPVGGPQG